MIVQLTGRRILASAAALVVLGLAVAWSGVINIGASTGHWAITDWFLHWAMRNTVRTYAALTVEEPAVEAGAVVSAASHYAANCAVCHGAPGEMPSPVMRAATPHAPDLATTAGTYSDAELFWIIKHGVKFTAMPAWPSLQRDDEIARMTAFVRRLPSMSASDYRALAYGAAGDFAGGRPVSFDAALAECERCHAEAGRGQPDIPVLAGQKPVYLREALGEFAAGRRASGVMSAAAARVDAPLRAALADHYASLPPVLADRPRELPAATDAARQAERVVADGLPERDLPACSNCHAPGKRADYPRLAGQKADYLAGRLRRWRGEDGAVEARLPDEPMPVIARRIPEHLIEPLARHFAGP